jgi:hypothetical protein
VRGRCSGACRGHTPVRSHARTFAPTLTTTAFGSGVVGYNVQIAVDTEHHLIVHHEVTNVGSDRSQLASTATAAKEVLGVEALEAVADRGYFNGEEIKACDDAGITVTLPKPMTSGAKSAGRFGKQDFVVCLADENVYRCPTGEKLKHYYTNEEKGQKLHRFWTNACRTCALKQRRITVGAQGGARGRADDARQESRCDAHATGDGRASLRNHKDAHGRDALSVQDVAEGTKVATEMALCVLTYNLMCVLTIVGVEKIMEAIPA